MAGAEGTFYMFPDVSQPLVMPCYPIWLAVWGCAAVAGSMNVVCAMARAPKWSVVWDCVQCRPSSDWGLTLAWSTACRGRCGEGNCLYRFHAGNASSFSALPKAGSVLPRGVQSMAIACVKQCAPGKPPSPAQARFENVRAATRWAAVM